MVNRPEKHGTERPLQNHHALLVAGFVEAARFLGGQPFAPFSTKRSHHPAVFEFVKNERVRRGAGVTKTRDESDLFGMLVIH